MEEKIRTYQYLEGLEMFYNGEVLGEAVYSARLLGPDSFNWKPKPRPGCASTCWPPA